MAVKLIHKALAEGHDFSVRLTLRVKIGSTLAAAHGEAGKGIFEGLLEPQKLQGSECDRRMEAKSSLVGADCTVELHAVPVVDLDLSLVIDPGYTEEDHSLRSGESLEKSFLSVFVFLLLDRRTKGAQNFPDSLMELRLGGILLNNAVIDFFYIRHWKYPPELSCSRNDLNRPIIFK